METIEHNSLIEITYEDIKKARESCGVHDVKVIRESMEAVEEWCKKQEHLAEACKYMDKVVLERIFILARGSVEGTKSKIEKLLTYRGMMPDLMLHRTFKEFEMAMDVVHYIPLPKLCPSDQSRVMVTQFLTGKLDEFSILTYFRYCFLIGEYRLRFDYGSSERYIIDLTNVHLGLLTKLNPVIIKKAEVLCTEGFGTKIKGIHILNAPPFVDRIVFLLKQALREKVAQRLHVHNSYEDLHKHIDKKILPKDYDGDEQSVTKLAERWKECLRKEETWETISEMDKLVTDESKRNTTKFNEEYMGMPGSFRKLNVD